jgi:hypothetical protein
LFQESGLARADPAPAAVSGRGSPLEAGMSFSNDPGAQAPGSS